MHKTGQFNSTQFDSRSFLNNPFAVVNTAILIVYLRINKNIFRVWTEPPVRSCSNWFLSYSGKAANW